MFVKHFTLRYTSTGILVLINDMLIFSVTAGEPDVKSDAGQEPYSKRGR